MSDLEERISNLEEYVDRLQLDCHAAKVAITVISTAYNGLGGQPGMLAQAFEEGIKQRGNIEFDSDAPEGYQALLIEKVADLLSKAD